MAMSGLPEDGELRLGPVTLPAGKRIRAAHGSGEPVAWVTVRQVPDPGRVWAVLSAACQETGLVPILLSGMGGDARDTRRPWDNGEFDAPADVTQLEGMDAASVLREMWDGAAYEGGDEDWAEQEEDEEEEDEEMVAMRAPFSRQFPGLAPAEGTSLGQDEIQNVLASLRPARLGLSDVSSITANLVNTPIWGFWWD